MREAQMRRYACVIRGNLPDRAQHGNLPDSAQQKKKRAGDGCQRGAQGGGENLGRRIDVASTGYRRPACPALGQIRSKVIAAVVAETRLSAWQIRCRGSSYTRTARFPTPDLAMPRFSYTTQLPRMGPLRNVIRIIKGPNQYQEAVMSNPPVINEQLLQEVREVNLAYLVLAQHMIRADRAQALYRLGVSEEVAAIIDQLTPAQLMKIAASNQLILRFRFDDDVVWNLLTSHSRAKLAPGAAVAGLHANIVMAGQFAESN
jgi:flagellar transcriptional activator FlhD